MMLSRLKEVTGNTKMLVHLLVCMFGFASWANLNGMWVELPLLVLRAPEKWTLPSYITVISQAANVGPLIFVTITLCLPMTKGKLEIYTSGGVILLSIVSSVLIGLFWDNTSYLDGEEHSTALLVLNFFMAFGDCVSSVAFYAFMSLLKPPYIASILFGEGLSGMLPSLIALAQGAGDIACVVNASITTNATHPNSTMEYSTFNLDLSKPYPVYKKPKFTVEVYFVILACLLACSFVAFVLLNILPYCRTEFTSSSVFTDQEKIVIETEGESKSLLDGESRTVSYNSSSNLQAHLSRKDDSDLNTRTDARLSNRTLCDGSRSSFLCYQAIVLLINMTLTSFLSTIQIYATLPYGLGPYHLVTTLNQIANAMACLFALLFVVQTLSVIFILTTIGQIGVIYIIYLAAMSPNPPLKAQEVGRVLSVSVPIVTSMLLVYVKVCIAMAMRKQGRAALIWTGMSTQVGSLIGAVVGFLLVNVYKVFISASYC